MYKRQANPTPLPNYEAIYGLSKESPLPALSLQLSDSCPYRCTFCRVWTHNGKFVQFQSSTQLERLEQARDLQDKGLVLRDRAGRTAIFIVDDLAAWGLPTAENLPPGMGIEEFQGLRQMRLQEYRSWEQLEFMDSFYTIAQVRAAHGDDPEMIETMVRGARNKMCYVGAEADDDEVLKAMNKQQRVADIERQLLNLKLSGVEVVGMGIIGLPMDTQEKILARARWFREHTKYSTVNWITHLWGTADAKYTQLRLLSEDGGIVPMLDYDGKVIDVRQAREHLDRVRVLRPAELPPYHRFTGRRTNFKDLNEERDWSPEYTSKLVDEYYTIVRPVDILYKRAAIQAGLVKWVDGRLMPISILNELARRKDALLTSASDLVKRVERRLRPEWLRPAQG